MHNMLLTNTEFVKFVANFSPHLRQISEYFRLDLRIHIRKECWSVTGPTNASLILDGDLAAAARQGDRQAFSELVCRHWEGAVRMVTRMIGDRPLAEDAAQEAFLRAWQRLSTYKPEHPFRNWLYSIAAHVALDFLRREPRTVDVDALEIDGKGPGPEAESEARERHAQVRRAVLDLPPASRAVLVLREYEGMSYQEIASALGIPVGTVMSRLSHARSQLRQSLATFLETK